MNRSVRFLGAAIVAVVALGGIAVAQDRAPDNPGVVLENGGKRVEVGERSGPEDGPSATDAKWAAMMIPHHQAGIELTMLALDKAVTPGVREVAAASQRDQMSELPVLQAIAKAGGLEAIPPEEPLQRFDQQTMEKLRSLSGKAFDRAWLDVLSSHHQGAIMMTDVAMAGARSDQAKQLQTKIHDGQLRQVATMNDLREQLG